MPKFNDKITNTSDTKVNLIDGRYVSLFNDGDISDVSAATADITDETSFIMDIPKVIGTTTDDSGDALFTPDGLETGLYTGDEVYLGSADNTAAGTYKIERIGFSSFKLTSPETGAVLQFSAIDPAADAHFVGDHPDTRRAINSIELRNYMQENVATSSAADDITPGNSAVSIETTVGNITLDAQANDANVIIKVDDGGSPVTAVTFDGSDDGHAIFNNEVTATTFHGALVGNITGNASGTAATVTSSTQAAITTCAGLIETGALAAGSIASGFGTIYTTNEIQTTSTLIGTGLTLGSAVITAAELETIDDVTGGTASGSKAVILDSSKNIDGINNITSTGKIDAVNADFGTGATAETQVSADGIVCVTPKGSISMGIPSDSGALSSSIFINDIIIRGNSDNAPTLDIRGINSTSSLFTVGTDGGVTSVATYNLGDTDLFSVDVAGHLVCQNIDIEGSFSLAGTVTVVNGTDVSTTSESFVLDSGATSPSDASLSSLQIETGTTEVINPSLKWTNADTMGLGWSLNTHGASGEEATNAQDRHIMTASIAAGIPQGEVEGTTYCPYNLSTGMIVIDDGAKDIYMYFA